MVLVDTIPKTDPAYPIVMAILRVVPASRWAFARPQSDGELGNLLGTGGNGGELAALKNEASRQREKSKTGPRIAATLGPLGDYASGVTLLFADGKASFGILTLLRTAELGPFTSSEIGMLTLALDSGSERLSSLRLNATAQARSTADHRDSAPNPIENPEGEHYVLDQDLQIVMTWTSQEQRRAALTGLSTRLVPSPSGRARRHRARAHRRLAERSGHTAAWRSSPGAVSRRAHATRVGSGGALHRRPDRPFSAAAFARGTGRALPHLSA